MPLVPEIYFHSPWTVAGVITQIAGGPWARMPMPPPLLPLLKAFRDHLKAKTEGYDTRRESNATRNLRCLAAERAVGDGDADGSLAADEEIERLAQEYAHLKRGKRLRGGEISEEDK